MSLVSLLLAGLLNCGAWPVSPAAGLAGGGSTNTLVIPLELLLDPFAPQLLSATSESNTSILLVFTESMQTSTSETVSNYCVELTSSVDTNVNGQATCNGTQLSVTAATVDITNSAQVRLTTAAQSAINYRVTVNGAQDQRGNVIAGVNWRFFDGTNN